MATTWARRGSVAGPKGDRGDPGARGSRITHGEGAPTSTDAMPGDMYVDTSTGRYYFWEEPAEGEGK